jgi:hypothetical protein
MSSWSQHYDDSSGQYYYMNEETGESTWEEPEGFNSSATADTEDVASIAHVEEVTIEVPTQEWNRVYHEESDMHYYVHSVTGESTWDVPDGYDPEIAATQEMAAAAANVTFEEPEIDTSEISDPPVTEQLSPEDDPANWETHWDEDNQLHYYMNIVTEASQWDIPDCINPELNAAGAEVAHEAHLALEEAAGHVDNDDELTAGNKHPTPPTSAPPSNRTTPDKTEQYEEGFAFSLLDRDAEDPSVGGNNKYSRIQSNIISELLDASKDATTPKVVVEEDNTPVPMEEKTMSSDNLIPTLDVKGIAHNISMANLTILLSSVQFEYFVELHFRAESIQNSPNVTPGFDASKTVVDASNRALNSTIATMSSMVTASARIQMMSWQSEPLQLSLCVINDADMVEAAVAINKAIMGYMGDRTTNKKPEELVQQILTVGLDSSVRLHDEIYCQIVKQLYHNPNIFSEEQGWRLLMICLACMPPSSYFAPYLMSFCITATNGMNTNAESADVSRTTSPLKGHLSYDLDDKSDLYPSMHEDVGMRGFSNSPLSANADDEMRSFNTRKDIKRMAELCIRYTIKSVKCNIKRTHPPTADEIEALTNGESQIILVNFIDNASVSIPIDSWSTVHDCELRIASQMALREENRCIFCLHEQIRSNIRQVEYDEHILQGFERIVDILSFHTVDQAAWKKQLLAQQQVPPSDKPYSRFLFKARVFADCTENGSFSADTDDACTFLLYKQALSDVLSSKYPITHDEAVTLAGLQAQEELGDYTAILRKLGYIVNRVKKVRQQDDVAVVQQEVDQEALSLLGVSFAVGEAQSVAEMKTTEREEEENVEVSEDHNEEYYYEKVFGNNNPIKKFLAKQYMGGLTDEAKKATAEKDVFRMYMKFKGMSSEDCRVAYMTIIRSCKLYGAQYFKVQPQTESGEYAIEEILAVTSREVVFISTKNLTYNQSYSYESIKSWGYSSDAIMLEIMPDVQVVSKQRGDSNWIEKVQPTKRYFKTNRAKTIADLLKAYNMYGR